MAIASGIR
ncbi:biopterin-dependent aromatic amino acid hydroxylase family protein, partial [Chlamydia psittaci 06-1683]